MIYLDNAATTRIAPEVLEVMDACNEALYGNPGSVHSAGWKAKQAVDQARAEVASVIGANPQQIIFTGGGSEANNLALLGMAEHLKRIGKKHILISNMEHKSVLECGKALSEQGFDVEYFSWSDALAERIREDTGLVSCMAVNNETGKASCYGMIGLICHNHGVLFHADCVQAYGKMPIHIDHADFITAAAHKIHGPKGVGMLYAKDRSLLSPVVLGGSQEFGLRAGTENVPGIVGFGKAARLAVPRLSISSDPFLSAERIYSLLSMRLSGVHLNAKPDPKSGIVNLRFDGVSGESLVLMLSSKGVMISAGSACTANSNKPSHVLKALGYSDEEARQSVRISISRYTTAVDMEAAVDAIVDSVNLLREAVEGGS